MQAFDRRIFEGNLLVEDFSALCECSSLVTYKSQGSFENSTTQFVPYDSRCVFESKAHGAANEMQI